MQFPHLVIVHDVPRRPFVNRIWRKTARCMFMMMAWIIFATIPTLNAANSDNKSSYDDLVASTLQGDVAAGENLRSELVRIDSAKADILLDKLRLSGNKRMSHIAIALAKHPDDWIRNKAIVVVGFLGIDSSDTLEILLNRLDDPSPMVCKTVNETLITIHDPRTWYTLITALDNSDADKKKSAHTVLSKICNEDMPPERYVWQSWYLQKLDTEQKLFDGFRSDLKSPDKELVSTAIEGLSSLELIRDQVVELLVATSHSLDSSVRSRIDDRLWQWTGSQDPSISSAAFAPVPMFFPPQYHPPAPTASPEPVAIAAPIEKGFFDTPLGMITLITAACGTLALVIWFFGTPAGKKLQETTNHYVHKAGTKVYVLLDKTEAQLTKRISKKEAALLPSGSSASSSSSSSSTASPSSKSSQHLTSQSPSHADSPSRRSSQRLTAIAESTSFAPALQPLPLSERIASSPTVSPNEPDLIPSVVPELVALETLAPVPRAPESAAPASQTPESLSKTPSTTHQSPQPLTTIPKSETAVTSRSKKSSQRLAAASSTDRYAPALQPLPLSERIAASPSSPASRPTLSTSIISEPVTEATSPVKKSSQRLAAVTKPSPYPPALQPLPLSERIAAKPTFAIPEVAIDPPFDAESASEQIPELAPPIIPPIAQPSARSSSASSDRQKALEKKPSDA